MFHRTLELPHGGENGKNGQIRQDGDPGGTSPQAFVKSLGLDERDLAAELVAERRREVAGG